MGKKMIHRGLLLALTVIVSIVFCAVAEMEDSVYDIGIKVECDENWFFSTYDVRITIDDEELAVLVHGEKNTYSVQLQRGIHTILFCKKDNVEVKGEVKIEVIEDYTFCFRIHCYFDEVSIQSSTPIVTPVPTAEPTPKPTNTPKPTPTPTPENLTVDNCPELAAMLTCKAEFDSSYALFAEKYKGRVIEFDGSIDYITRHGSYKTRFDISVSAGDYSITQSRGPYFQFKNVNCHDMDLGTMYLQDEIWVGRSVHIIAKVEEYNSRNGLFYLDPVSVKGRISSK